MNAVISYIKTIDPMFAGTVLVGFATIAMLVAMYVALTIRNPMDRRMRALADRRAELRAGIIRSKPRKRASIVRRNQTTDKMRDVLASLKVLQDTQLAEAQQKLAQAGIRKKEWAVAIIFARMVGPLILGSITALAIYGFDVFPEWGTFKRFMAFAGVTILSYKAADLVIANLAKRRTDAIRKGLPDALDLLVICAEAGLTVDAAFNRVSGELGRAYPELGDEFSLTAIELSFLTTRRKAYENLAWRVNLDAVKGVVTTLIQTERYGTPLASSLRVLSAEFRHDRMMRAEAKAARLPAIMTVPLILFILPVLFIVILAPAACSIADAFSGGIGG